MADNDDEKRKEEKVQKAKEEGIREALRGGPPPRPKAFFDPRTQEEVTAELEGWVSVQRVNNNENKK